MDPMKLAEEDFDLVLLPGDLGRSVRLLVEHLPGRVGTGSRHSRKLRPHSRNLGCGRRADRGRIAGEGFAGLYRRGTGCGGCSDGGIPRGHGLDGRDVGGVGVGLSPARPGPSRDSRQGSGPARIGLGAAARCRERHRRTGLAAEVVVESIGLGEERADELGLLLARHPIAAEEGGIEAGRRLAQRHAEVVTDCGERALRLGRHLPQLADEAAAGMTAGEVEEEAIGMHPGVNGQKRFGGRRLVEAPIERIGHLPRTAENEQPRGFWHDFVPEVEEQERPRIFPAPRLARGAAGGNELAGSRFEALGDGRLA